MLTCECANEEHSTSANYGGDDDFVAGGGGRRRDDYDYDVCGEIYWRTSSQFPISI